MIANSYLNPPIQDSYNLSGIKILCNKAHLYLPIETFTSLTVSTSQFMCAGRQLRSVLNLNSFNLRMTVEVETAELSAITVIGTFSINFLAFLLDDGRDLVVLLD